MSSTESLLLGFVPLDLLLPEYTEELMGMVAITDATGLKWIPNNAVASFMKSDLKAGIDADMVAQAEREKIRKSVQNA